MTVLLALLDKYGKNKLEWVRSWTATHYGAVLLAFALFACFQAWLDQ
jgi:hypothetical protein